MGLVDFRTGVSHNSPIKQPEGNAGYCAVIHCNARILTQKYVHTYIGVCVCMHACVTKKQYSDNLTALSQFWTFTMLQCSQQRLCNVNSFYSTVQ